MTRNKILNGITITAISAILLAWAPSTAYGGGEFLEGGIFDIKPGSCPNPINLRSNGVVPVAVLGSATLDVNDIVLSPTQETWKPRIEDVGSPFQGKLIDKFSCIEGGPDGFDDLTLKIPVSDLQTLCVVADGTTVAFGITITLNDGTVFRVFDVVTTLEKNKACV